MKYQVIMKTIGTLLQGCIASLNESCGGVRARIMRFSVGVLIQDQFCL